MSVITIATPPVTDPELLRRVMTEAGEPAGLLHRFLGRTEDGSLRVVAHWESRDAALQFFATRLGPAIASVMTPEPAGMPEVTWLDVADVYERASLHA